MVQLKSEHFSLLLILLYSHKNRFKFVGSHEFTASLNFKVKKRTSLLVFNPVTYKYTRYHSTLLSRFCLLILVHCKIEKDLMLKVEQAKIKYIVPRTKKIKWLTRHRKKCIFNATIKTWFISFASLGYLGKRSRIP